MTGTGLPTSPPEDVAALDPEAVNGPHKPPRKLRIRRRLTFVAEDGHSPSPPRQRLVSRTPPQSFAHQSPAAFLSDQLRAMGGPAAAVTATIPPDHWSSPTKHAVSAGTAVFGRADESPSQAGFPSRVVAANPARHQQLEAYRTVRAVSGRLVVSPDLAQSPSQLQLAEPEPVLVRGRSWLGWPRLRAAVRAWWAASLLRRWHRRQVFWLLGLLALLAVVLRARRAAGLGVVAAWKRFRCLLGWVLS